MVSGESLIAGCALIKSGNAKIKSKIFIFFILIIGAAKILALHEVLPNLFISGKNMVLISIFVNNIFIEPGEKGHYRRYARCRTGNSTRVLFFKMGKHHL